MDPALSILDRALGGDTGALSFLERTASIYVYDVTNSAQPKICGAWDFLSQALTEIERYDRISSGNVGSFAKLDGHVQLLATMARRAAKRSPASDQKLVEICLANAAHYHGSTEQAGYLINLNHQLRDREMGRLAAMVFDYSHHRQFNTSHQPQIYQSPFCNPVAMESMCAVVATNAISTGPREFVSLVTEWIAPSINNLPAYAVASIICHLATETKSKSAPEGTQEALSTKLFDPVISRILAPMFQEAVRESDAGDGRVRNQRTAAMILKALEGWSAATACSLVRVKQLCQNANINMIEVISDAMYSDSELVMDALSEFLETLLRRHAEDEVALEGLGMGVAGGFLPKKLGTLSNSLNNFEQYLTTEISERRAILAELISAVGLQRFRFMDRLSNGDTDVCRCLASIARSIVIASQTEIKSGKLEGSERGLIDLLLKSATHPSIHVCGIAFEALIPIITTKSGLATQVLPIVQGKAIIPPSLIGISSQDECDVDYHEFERFREHLLVDILLHCYTSNRSYYLESCATAVEEFCSILSSPTPQTPYQLEAALFCLGAVSIDASKRALLVSASPAAQEAALKACNLRNDESLGIENIANDSRIHDEQLARTIHALYKGPSIATSSPLSLSQMCILIGKYAKWISQTPSDGVLEYSATLALKAFDQAATACQEKMQSFDDISISPFADAATALRNILSRSPHRFTTAEALSTLEKGWKSMYNSSLDDGLKISMEDRKALCTGITRVLAVLPQDQWISSLSHLSTPTIECIEVVTKRADELKGKVDSVILIPRIIERMSEEISVLAIAIRTFNHATIKSSSDATGNGSENPVRAVLHRVWPCINHIATTYCLYENISSSLSEFLLVAVSLSETHENVHLLTKICETAVTMIDTISNSVEPKAIEPILGFVKGVIDAFGHTADAVVKISSAGCANENKDARQVRDIVEQLTCRVFRQLPSNEDLMRSGAQVEVLPAIFSICSACIQICPFLFLTLSIESDDSQNTRLFLQSVNIAISSLKDKHIDVARTAMMFIKEVVLLSIRETDTSNQLQKTVSTECRNVISHLFDEIVATLILGACGNLPREALDPAATLLHCILKSSSVVEAESMLNQAMSQDCFRLGDHPRKVAMITIGKCTHGDKSLSLLMDLFDDMWTMHQTDDNGSGVAAGGDHLRLFTQKYGDK